MALFNRKRRTKSADTGEAMSLNQLLEFLGVHHVEGSALSEATYFACLKVLSESLGKLPLKLQQTTPQHGVRIAREGHGEHFGLRPAVNFDLDGIARAVFEQAVVDP